MASLVTAGPTGPCRSVNRDPVADVARLVVLRIHESADAPALSLVERSTACEAYECCVDCVGGLVDGRERELDVSVGRADQHGVVRDVVGIA